MSHAPQQDAEAGPWYRDGLRFTCTQCGDCCTGAAGAVWVNDEELAAIAETLGQPVGEIRLMHTRRIGNRVSLREYANGDCTFFDPATRRCRVYAARPRQCRSWPFWSSNLESAERWDDVRQSCPGAGRGEFFSLEEIEAQAASIVL
ncbi:MAG: YkgJ family cysteine cluster protein [Planctomycetales bacterium]